MSIYIARPKANAINHSFNLTAKKFTPESRQSQLEEITTLYQENKTYQNIQDWVKDRRSEGSLEIIKEPNQPGVTGTVVIKMSADIAEQMRREVPNALVIQDTPIELIQPQRDKIAPKAELSNDDLWHLQAIGLNPARLDDCAYTGKGVTVAVLDTGIDPTHPALIDKVTEAYRFRGNDWRVDKEAISTDVQGHGTHVAGLICGRRVGIAPDAKLISGLTLSQQQGTGTLTDLVLALDWVANRSDVQIVNISAGIPAFLDNLEFMIKSLLSVGVLPVCAVGNDGQDYNISPGNCRGVISVGASTRENQVWGNSGSGQINVNSKQAYNVPSLVAPGKAVYSSVIGGLYEAWNGTSMATPIVTGVAALILEADPFISVEELRASLLRKCQKLPEDPDERQGAGLIQI